jgi:hypothetical protein
MGRTFVVLAVVCLLAASLLARSLHSAQQTGLPPVPDLPAKGWPSPGDAEPFTRALIAGTTPEQLDTLITASPDILPAILRNLGTALLTHDAALQTALKSYLTAFVRVHAKRLPQRFTDDDLHSLVTLQVVDPLRYGEDDEFRRTVDTILPQSLERSLPEPLRRADINEINRVAPIAFDTAEALAAAAGVVTRPSRTRYADSATASAKITTNGTEAIEASIFSINSRFATSEDARRFLRAVRAAAPKRKIVVIGDPEMRAALNADLTSLSIDFVDDLSRPITLWPRDPFFVARTGSGQVIFVNRPNLQSGREEDANMVRILIEGLPQSLDTRWQHPRWTTGSTSFHNGQVLMTPQAAWISIHSVEPRVLQLLKRDTVPTEEFSSAAGIARYVAAAHRAAGELAALAGRPVKFVHDLPGNQPAESQSKIMAMLGGGAGFDLDSIVTLLPQTGRPMEALVGDLTLGSHLADAAPADDWISLAKTYSLDGNAASIHEAVRNFHESAVALGLQAFLDRCEKDLAASGVHVRRLPLLIVPTSLLSSSDDRLNNPYFLVGWNNVVLERTASNRAEGFASGFASGDRAASSAYSEAGYNLLLFPPLPRSVILNGGYRCASNEVRAAR